MKRIGKITFFVVGVILMVLGAFLYTPSAFPNQATIDRARAYPIPTSLPPVTPVPTETPIPGQPQGEWINVFVRFENNYTIIGNAMLSCSYTDFQNLRVWDDDPNFPGTAGNNLVIKMLSGNGTPPDPNSNWISQESWVFGPTNPHEIYSNVSWAWSNLYSYGGDIFAPEFWVMVRFSVGFWGTYNYLVYPCGIDTYIPLIRR